MDYQSISQVSWNNLILAFESVNSLHHCLLLGRLVVTVTAVVMALGRGGARESGGEEVGLLPDGIRGRISRTPIGIRFKPAQGVFQILPGSLLVGDGVGVLGQNGQDMPSIRRLTGNESGEPAHDELIFPLDRGDVPPWMGSKARRGASVVSSPAKGSHRGGILPGLSDPFQGCRAP